MRIRRLTVIDFVTSGLDARLALSARRRGRTSTLRELVVLRGCICYATHMLPMLMQGR